MLLSFAIAQSNGVSGVCVVGVHGVHGDDELHPEAVAARVGVPRQGDAARRPGGDGGHALRGRRRRRPRGAVCHRGAALLLLRAVGGQGAQERPHGGEEGQGRRNGVRLRRWGTDCGCFCPRVERLCFNINFFLLERARPPLSSFEKRGERM